MAKLAGVVLLPFLLATAAAQESASTVPSAEEIMQRVKRVLDPRRAGIRELTMTLSAPGAEDRSWQARQAWKPTEAGLNRLVWVMEQPAEIRGSAILIAEKASGPDAQWVWIPAVGRVRKIVPIGRFEGVFGTDFTYADLGFLSLRGRTYGAVELSEVGGVPVYVVTETVPHEPWYYSRIETAVDRESLLPLQRLFYDEAGDLWKRQIFERVESVEGEPTVFSMRMINVFENASSSIVYDDVVYGDVPERVFDPSGLPKLLADPVWKGSMSKD